MKILQDYKDKNARFWSLFGKRPQATMKRTQSNLEAFTKSIARPVKFQVMP